MTSLQSTIIAVIVNFIIIFDLLHGQAAEIDANGNIISGYSSAVHEKGWVTENIDDHKMIIKNNNITDYLDQRRNFKNKVTLTFITPWNEKGYKWTKLYAKKFTHISPVWYDIQPIPGSTISSYMIMGESKVNLEWIDAVKEKNERINIIPRYAMSSEHWSMDQVTKLIKSKKAQKEFTSILSKSLRNKRNGYSGCVLEITPIFNFLAHNQRMANEEQITKKELNTFRKKFRKFLDALAKRLRKQKKYIVLVMSPYHIGLLNLKLFHKIVRMFVLMTYDYSVNQGKQGANSPLIWTKEIMETIKSKIQQRYEWKYLIGLNFYGYKYSKQGTEAIIGDQLIELLKKEGDDYKWKWDQDIMEHYLVNQNDDSIKIYYPTLQSIATRLELLSMYDFGATIWELGQGMEYFTDLL